MTALQPVPLQDAATLADLATAINRAHQDAEKTAQSALEYARQAGELLLEAKARVKYGDFATWLLENCEVKKSQAYKYIKLAENWDELQQEFHSSGILGLYGSGHDDRSRESTYARTLESAKLSESTA